MFETGKSLSAISKFDSVLEKNQPIYINMNILQTPSKVGVLQNITFSHTPDEAMFVGLAKACVL